MEISIATSTPMSISPWADKAQITSPDGRWIASIAEAGEIGMGAPTLGVLRISNGLTRPSCNPFMVWSSDSEYLAVPQWTRDRRQRLMIISFSRRASRYGPGEYRVLELESFESGVVRGIDSPAHLPAPIQVDITLMHWEDPSF